MPGKDHLYDTPTDGTNPLKMVWKELDKKAAKEVVEAKMEGLEADIDRVEAEVTKPHVCAQDSRLQTMESQSKDNQKAISDMYRWFARGFGAIVFVLLTSGVAFVWYLSGLSYNLESNNGRLENLEKATDKEDKAPVVDSATLEPVLQRVADTAVRKALQTGQ